MVLMVLGDSVVLCPSCDWTGLNVLVVAKENMPLATTMIIMNCNRSFVRFVNKTFVSYIIGNG